MVTADYIFPLSFQQEEMLGHMRALPECAARYDLIHLFRLDPEPDSVSFSQAVAELCGRHPALRTVIACTGDGDNQEVLGRQASVAVPVEHAASLDELTAGLIDQRHSTAAVLAGARLFRVRRFAVGPVSYVAFTIHHLICDGWSTMVLWRDLATIYAALRDGRQAELTPLSMTYGDFARQQRAEWPRLAESAIPFWRSRAEGCSATVSWPRPDDPGAAAPNEVEIRTVFVGGNVLPGLRRYAATARATIFMVLLAATAAAISRMSGSADLMIGSDTADREDLTRQAVVGHFVNTRLVRVRPNLDAPLAELVAEVRSLWLDAERYRDAYADQILRRIGEPEVVKVNMVDFPGMNDPFPIGECTAFPVEVSPNDPLRHQFGVIWRAVPDGYTAYIVRQKRRVAEREVRVMAEDLLSMITEIAGDLQAKAPATG